MKESDRETDSGHTYYNSTTPHLRKPKRFSRRPRSSTTKALIARDDTHMSRYKDDNREPIAFVTGAYSLEVQEDIQPRHRMFTY